MFAITTRKGVRKPSKSRTCKVTPSSRLARLRISNRENGCDLNFPGVSSCSLPIGIAVPPPSFPPSCSIRRPETKQFSIIRNMNAQNLFWNFCSEAGNKMSVHIFWGIALLSLFCLVLTPKAFGGAEPAIVPPAGLQAMQKIECLPLLPASGTQTRQFSSYDPSRGNEDGKIP